MTTTVYVCKKCKRNGCVAGALASHTTADVRMVGCQKVCKEPVAGLEVRGRMEWFGRLDGAKALASFVKLVDRDGDAALPGRLDKRRSVKRSGRPPR